MQTENLIIGGGLSGLYLAYQLTQRGEDFLLVEARDRLGGRIDNHRGVDLGPTWFWPGQHRIAKLAKELGITAFEQQNKGDILYEDPNVQSERIPSQQYQMTSYRLEDGTSRLIEGLATEISTDRILLGHHVTALSHTNNGIEVRLKTSNNTSPITTKRVFLALPPRLIAQHITFTPTLDEEALGKMTSIPTWMAGQAKAAIQFETPFWRDHKLSGQAFSRLGPLVEIHDASAAEDAPYALFGFIGGTPRQRKEIGEIKLKHLIKQQIERLYGTDTPAPLEITIKDWSTDQFTATKEDMEPLQSHPSYGLPKALTNLWNNQLILTGTEVASSEGGYLEGALIAADDAIAHIT
ncbi:flavin monoamine oxidase family protein [Kiloniella antarctica]|uniref:Flavin monoamine oxidase family protein n=1 Tax=Kiloniella antarctica TaxID=1550907 RepID=A0ABW5BGK4_9PROT